GLVSPAPAGYVGGLRLAGDVSNVSMVLCRSRICGSDPASLLRTRGETTIVPSHGGAAAGDSSKEVAGAFDQGLAGLEHRGRVDRALVLDRRVERIVRANDLDPRRLAVVPLSSIVDAIGANDAVLGSDLRPELGLRTARSADAVHVDGQSVRMQRIELVAESADAERGRPVGREDSNLRQSLFSRLPDRTGQAGGKLGMQATNCHIRALPYHRSTRMSGLDEIGAVMRDVGGLIAGMVGLRARRGMS